MPFQYRLTGESLDDLSGVLYQKRLLGMTRGVVNTPTNTLQAANAYFGDLKLWSGLLPTQAGKRRLQGKRTAAAYKRAFQG